MPFKNTLRLLCAVGLAAVAACHPAFQPLKFPTNEALYQASLKKLQGHHWDDAVAGFEQLSTALPARDPLMPIVLFDLGKAYHGKGDDLLAAQSYSRVPESFPDGGRGDIGSSRTSWSAVQEKISRPVPPIIFTASRIITSASESG